MRGAEAQGTTVGAPDVRAAGVTADNDGVARGGASARTGARRSAGGGLQHHTCSS